METTNKETKKFIKDLRKVFKKHDVYLDIYDNYDKRDDINYGERVEIKSCDSDKNDSFIIYLNDMKKLSDKLYNWKNGN